MDSSIDRVGPARWTLAQRTHFLVQLPAEFESFGVSAHLQGGLLRYVVDGILPGGFLQACLCADLAEAARRGDPSSLLSLPGLMAWLEHRAPAECWGSRAKVLAWTVTPDRLEIVE